ncbi:MAG: anaerobic ribonucleoside-triphosphate reductase activating protein [Fastidiosipilaceae bacterium]|jgi:pyruvate formate lyase activating enzyme
MRIAGIQKLSLLDYPGQLACTIFTSGCNFACPFCHNPSLVLPELFPPPISVSEVLAFLEDRRSVLDAVCITGGEPLLQPDLAPFLQSVKNLGYLIKVDHNASMPDRLAALIEKGLVDYVAIDIKNEPNSYAETVGLESFDPAVILRCLDLLRETNTPFECRTTVVKEFHDSTKLHQLAAWIYPCERYFLQKFSTNNDILSSKTLTAYSDEEMDKLLSVVSEILLFASKRG